MKDYFEKYYKNNLEEIEKHYGDMGVDTVSKECALKKLLCIVYVEGCGQGVEI